MNLATQYMAYIAVVLDIMQGAVSRCWRYLTADQQSTNTIASDQLAMSEHLKGALYVTVTDWS